jgi:hypothetical protein
MNKQNLDMLLLQLPTGQSKLLRNIINTTSDSEERWIKIKNFFMVSDPERIDDRFAWNLYKATL